MTPVPLKKRLEYRWKGLWLRALATLLGGRAAARALDDGSAQPRRVLFLRQDRIGDAIVTSGFLRALATGGTPPAPTTSAPAAPNPNATPTSPATSASPAIISAGPGPGPDPIAVDVLASPANADLLRSLPWVNAVHVYDKRRWRSFPGLLRRLRAARYDAVFDCMVTAPSMTAVLIMLASGARHRVGIAGRGVDAALTIPVERSPGAVHIIDRIFDLGRPLGMLLPPEQRRPVLAVPPDALARAESAWRSASLATGPRLLVNISSRGESRTWPDDRFIHVIRAVAPPGGIAAPRVLVLGAPGEWGRARRIASVAGAAAVPTPTFMDAAALARTADVVLTPDTSIAHLPSAFRKPAVVLNTRGQSAEWGLYLTPGTNVEGDDDTLAAIQPPTVLAALRPLLAAAATTVEPLDPGRTGRPAPA